MTENKYDSIVVGGGIAGLTSACYLARSGQKVLLIEKNKEFGGLVSTFSRDGFTFDAGVRALEDAGIIMPLLRNLNINLEFVKSPVSVGIEDRIIDIESVNSLENYRQLLVHFFPNNEREIDELLQIIRKVMKHMEVLYGVENPAFKDLKSDFDYIFRRLLPWMPKFLFTVRKINKFNMPVDDYLDSFITSPALRDMIAQHFFKETPSFFALSYFSLYLDYFYPKGGVGKLAYALVDKILEFGGELMADTKIVEVKAADKIVIDQNNSAYRFDNLVWASDLKSLYSFISDSDKLKSEDKKSFELSISKIQKGRGGDSVFTLFVEVDEPLDSFRRIANGHFFYTPTSVGLGEVHKKELDNLLEDFDNVPREVVYDWLDRFTKLNTYEISIPGLKDPDLVPPGKTGLIISFLAEYYLFDKIRKSGWLDEFITEMEARIIDVISGSVYPMLKDKIIRKFSFSPLSIENRVGSSEGGITGWAFGKTMPVMNKIQFANKSVFTPIPDIFQAGQWAYSPAGVPMSILTGKLAADNIIKKRKNSK